MKALAGLLRIMTGSDSTTAIGKANAAGWNTITRLIVTTKGISAITTAIATITMTAIASTSATITIATAN